MISAFAIIYNLLKTITCIQYKSWPANRCFIETLFLWKYTVFKKYREYLSSHLGTFASKGIHRIPNPKLDSFCHCPRFVPTYVELIHDDIRSDYYYILQQNCTLCSVILGQKLDHSTASSILHDCGIQNPDWRSMGKFLGFESHILSIALFEQWHAHAHDCNPSWERLARVLDNIQQCKNAAAAAHRMSGKQTWHLHKFTCLWYLISV